MAETYEPDDECTTCRKTEYSICYRHRFRNVYHSDLYDIQYHQFHPKAKIPKRTWFDSNAVAGLVFYGSIVLTVGACSFPAKNFLATAVLGSYV